jgi:hypothetical protein
MPTQEENDLKNKNSLSEQRAARSRRNDIKELRKQRKAELTGVLNTRDKRETKAKFDQLIDSRLNTNKSSSGGNEDGGVWDTSTVDTDIDNKQGTDTRIENDGVDNNNAEGGGVAEGLPEFPGDEPENTAGLLVWDDTNDEGRWLEGWKASTANQFRFLYADGGVYTVSADDVFNDGDLGEDFYSLNFVVSGVSFNSAVDPTFQIGFEPIHDAPIQTFYRFFFWSGGLLSTSGTFRENIYCKNGSPVVEWIRIT